MAFREYTAEYSKRGQCGTGICVADTVEELMGILVDRGYVFSLGEKERLLNWSRTGKKKYYGTRLIVRRGELEMTEYTAFQLLYNKVETAEKAVCRRWSTGTDDDRPS